jgi:hypothetical protein
MIEHCLTIAQAPILAHFDDGIEVEPMQRIHSASLAVLIMPAIDLDCVTAL